MALLWSRHCLLFQLGFFACPWELSTLHWCCFAQSDMPLGCPPILHFFPSSFRKGLFTLYHSVALQRSGGGLTCPSFCQLLSLDLPLFSGVTSLPPPPCQPWLSLLGLYTGGIEISPLNWVSKFVKWWPDLSDLTVWTPISVIYSIVVTCA